MTANVYRDPAATGSVMSSEYKNAAETIFVPLMQRAGLMSISVKKVSVAIFTKTVPEVEYFCDLPPEMKAFSLMVQTPLADILALFGIVKIEIQASDDERESLKSTYEALVAAAAQQVAGSAESGDGGVNAKEDTKADKPVEKPESKPVCSKPVCCRRRRTKS